MVTSMVLRFRDLIALTIPEHQKIIRDCGEVWWGWWNKPEEKIPRDTFAQFLTRITTEGHLDIFLIDSGARTLYKAQLKAIHTSATEEPESCPDLEKTPTYYRDFKYKAWFLLSQISRCESAEIRNWSYEEVPEFIADPSWRKFQNKRVCGIEELLERRHRTIYFIQPYATEHSDFEIKPDPAPEPANFHVKPLLRNSSYVLHLSDLHFSRGKHAFSLTTSSIERKLATLIVDQLRSEYKDKPPATVVISGDLTWLGLQEEFDYAVDFIKDLKSFYGLGPDEFIIVPGNHDMQWDEADNTEYDRSRPVILPPSTAQNHYRAFYKRVFGVNASEFLSMGRRYVLENYVGLDIIGLNSCQLEQRHLCGYGFVGAQQLSTAAASSNWIDSNIRAKYRMLVLHHHVLPVTPQEEIDTYDRIYSLTLDAGQVLYKALELEVDLILHGHMHQPFASSHTRAAKGSKFSPARSISIHGAGSAGATRDYLGSVGKNSYTVLEFDDQGVTARIYSRSENISGFEEDWRCRFSSNPSGGLTTAGVDPSVASDD